MHIGNTVGNRRKKLADFARYVRPLEIGAPIDSVFSPHVGGIDMNKLHLLQGDAAAANHVRLDREIVQVFGFDPRA